MAIGKDSDLQIYHDEFHSGLMEAIDTNIDAFNEATNGCIRLVAATHIGNYQKDAFFKEISGLVSRRDIASTAAVTPLAITEGEEARVKIHRKVGPVAQTLGSLKKIGMNMDSSEFSLMLGAGAAPRIVKDMILTAIKAAAAAVANNSGVLQSNTGATVTYAGIVQALAKFGDAADMIRCLVFHSKQWYDLVNTMTGSSTELLGVGQLAVSTGVVPAFGRRVLVIDSPDLIVSGSPDNYRMLGLCEGGVTVIQSEEVSAYAGIEPLLEQLSFVFQAEHGYSLGLKGYTWDIANGGANPADAALATGGNWDKVATSDKNTAGVMLRTQ